MVRPPLLAGSGGYMSSNPSLPVAAALMLAGGTLGFAAHFAMSSDNIVTKVVTEEKVVAERLSDEEIAEICETVTLDEKERLRAAQDRVTDLKASLESREMELAELRDKQRRAREAGVALGQRLKELESEVEELRTQLEDVTEERDNLIVELKTTVRKLEVQIRETEKYKKEAKKWKRKSTANAWRSFIAEAKVNMCDRGTRKRHEKCHAAVEEAMSEEIQDLFEKCVDSYQAIPILGQVEKGAGLPAFAQEITDDRRFTNRGGWHIRFCDPTLPEAGEQL
jgi:chromosome segregation ATPase